jgi:hypothetical protein
LPARRVHFAVGLIAVLLAPVMLRAQLTSDATARFNRDLEQIHRDTAVLANPAVPADQRALIDYGGYFTTSYLSLDDLNRNNHSLWQFDLVGYADVNIDNVQEFFVRGRLEWQEFSQGDAFDGRDHQFHADFERLWYSVDLAKALSAYRGVTPDYDIAVKGGRQLVYWADGLSLNQTLDGAIIDASWKQTHVQVLGGLTPANTIDIDSSRPLFDSNTHRGFYGAMLTQDIGTQKPFVYFISQQDYNHDYVAVLGTGANEIKTRFKYNSDYLGIGSTGTLGDHMTYGAEAVYESGTTLSNSFDDSLAPVHQTKNDIHAFAGDLRISYLLNDTRLTRLSAEGIFATGNDGRRNTTNTLGGSPPNSHDTAFNGFGQVQNGIAFSPNISNLFILRAGASTFPLRQISAFKQLQMGLDLYLYEKFAVSAPLDEPTRKSGYVGVEPDLFVNWQIKSDITLAMRYGIFFPGDALLSNNCRQFFYTGLTFAF